MIPRKNPATSGTAHGGDMPSRDSHGASARPQRSNTGSGASSSYRISAGTRMSAILSENITPERAAPRIAPPNDPPSPTSAAMRAAPPDQERHQHPVQQKPQGPGPGRFQDGRLDEERVRHAEHQSEGGDLAPAQPQAAEGGGRRVDVDEDSSRTGIAASPGRRNTD